MRISDILIRNFRGISFAEASDLGDTIIVAGQNGSGKSCIFDAIRLLKSVYGGYQQNEWQHFFTEFAIQLHGGSRNIQGLFNNKLNPIQIQTRFSLRDREKRYIHDNASELLEETIWQSVLPEAFQYGGYHKAMFAAQFREKQPEVSERVAMTLPLLMAELTNPSFLARVDITPAGEITIAPSQLLSVAFTNYRPREIGVIDFHGAQRHYGRELVQGINLSLDQANQVKSQSSLYNYNNKYNNVKSEMAGNYVKELLAERANGSEDHLQEGSLTSAMKELFSSFFPDKEFLGPQPTADGSLSFPVRTPNGTQHDLDELSSGEKEILYGYLRIRSSAPKDSIILLDEPELHLNPRLIRGLPEFYRKHLGELLENQLWLVTHSDALIREAIGKPGFNVFHMLPCGTEGNGSQLRSLTATKDLDLVLTDLVGDLAAYRPGGKGVIFEGGGDSDFDKTLVTTLFPEEVRGINLISGSNKTRVKALHQVLKRAYEAGDLPTKFYAVIDRDSDDVPVVPGVSEHSWNVYHIENYLLEPKFVAESANSFRLDGKMTEEQALEKLREAARKVVPATITHRLREHVNSEFIRGINLGFDPTADDLSKELVAATTRSFERVKAAVTVTLSEANLRDKESELRRDVETSFGNGTWRERLPGREILKQFVASEAIQTNYEAFRNQIVSRMASAGHKPQGMQVVIDAIKSD